MRAPVTIAILAWNSWETTRACLDSLRPTLGVRDQVVVVDNGSTDGTAAGLRAYPWVDVVTNAENRGFAGGCNDAAAHARHDIIIFLNNDTVLAGHWIEPLVKALATDGVGAAGPRSNFVSGPQIVETATYSSSSQMRRFARDWMQSHRGQTTPTERLVGFCLAVRSSAYEQIGGFDEAYGTGGFEDDDLCQRLLQAGWELLICHDSFVHHEGHKTFQANGLDWLAEQDSNRDRFISTHISSGGRVPLVSACLIVKDEEERLGDCLRSLQPVVDEMVVYDTGSSDGTVALARSFGATVIEGYWDDDFARARNDALSHCKGEWIAWLDADETLEYADPAVVRSLLARTKPEIDAWSVRINNLTGAGAGSEFVHHAARIFRRRRCEWIGRLHEQIHRRGGA
ncbi:MAG TPA: glycosyltransferase [Acidimicrobiales bacterium]|nr:glycosyltransferase [Acidimicrobiales bacterium]